MRGIIHGQSSQLIQKGFFYNEFISIYTAVDDLGALLNKKIKIIVRIIFRYI